MSKLDEILEKKKEKDVATGIRIANLEAELKDCVNELCLQCGHYKQEHEGACADCRWLKVRRGW